MKNPPTIDEIAALILIIGCLVLIFLGINSEVKAILAMAAGWTFKSGYTRRPTHVPHATTPPATLPPQT